MALPKEVQDAVAAADSAMVGCDDTIGVRQWQTIRAELHRLSDELADYKNASLHAADDCTAKDAEIARLQSGIAKHVNSVCDLQSRLAAADALLQEVYDHGENMALHEKIAAHLSENTHDRA